MQYIMLNMSTPLRSSNLSPCEIYVEETNTKLEFTSWATYQSCNYCEVEYWAEYMRLHSQLPLRVFWSFAASHFTSLQRINLYRIYIHQEWAAAVSATLLCTAVHCWRYARVSFLTAVNCRWSVEHCTGGDMHKSHVFWCVPTPSPPSLLGTLDKSLKTWTARLAYSSQAPININKRN